MSKLAKCIYGGGGGGGERGTLISDIWFFLGGSDIWYLGGLIELYMGAWMGVNRITNWGPYLLLNNELELYFLTIFF